MYLDVTQANALVGYTGFVGGNLARQATFSHFYNSANIEAISGQAFDTLVVAALPAAMWIANRDPDGDRRNLDRLLEALGRTKARQVIWISTVAVYPDPVNVDEGSPIDVSLQTPYGRHRFLAEQFAFEHFPQVLCVRLPGLFGPGLKKNALHDLMNQHEVHKLNSESIYQFYNLERLTRDISAALAARLSLVNFATPPLKLSDVASEVFGIEFSNDPGTPPARYHVRSKHFPTGYLTTRKDVLADLKRFVKQHSLSVTNLATPKS